MQTPSKRTPVPGVTVTATRADIEVVGQTYPTGYFHLNFSAGLETGKDLTMTS